MSNKHYEFQMQALELARQEFPDALILQNTCAKGIDLTEQFPSIPVILDETIVDIIIAKRENSKQRKNKFVHTKPDIGVIDYNSIDRVYIRGERIQEKDWRQFFEESGLSNSILNQKMQGPLISVFDNSIPENIENNWNKESWRKNKPSCTDFAIILKKNKGFLAVCDAKNYIRTAVSKKEINKLILDASLLAAEKCFLICPVNTKIPALYNGCIKTLGRHKLIKLDSYRQPEFHRTREDCRKDVLNKIRRKDFRYEEDSKVIATLIKNINEEAAKEGFIKYTSDAKFDYIAFNRKPEWEKNGCEYGASYSAENFLNNSINQLEAFNHIVGVRVHALNGEGEQNKVADEIRSLLKNEMHNELQKMFGRTKLTSLYNPNSYWAFYVEIPFGSEKGQEMWMREVRAQYTKFLKLSENLLDKYSL